MIEKLKELRNKTGVGIMDCKRALEEAKGDIDTAVEILRKKGIAKAEKKLGRITKEGVIGSYIHPGEKLGVLVEVNCETDFVANNKDFRKLVRELAMHIAACSPLCVDRGEVPENVTEKEKEIYTEQARRTKKPEKIIPRIVEGKMEKFYADNCLLEQPFVKDPERTVADILKEGIAKFGENITVRRFVRYRLGEE
ncbi:elongation factor Ts [candidate division TA06 bacterium DG_26]|uniref:Elongation factor Ts n=1 Tax=candidate division TA06 bacterium DG_26 TaxID=1703771 RepID=A0A0S7WLW1_UNCT6|nr:MAG: elongation factor Ts [candidate division TA06 bacterium DG_26]